MKLHYSYYGESGSTKVLCGKYFTTDVKHTELKDKVTCINCKKLLKH